MMLKTNLSSRPFYNESLVNALLALAVLVGLGLTAFNITRASALYEERSKSTDVRDKALADATRIRAEAQRESKSIDQGTLFYLGAQTQEANSIIDERRFSWTVFFDLMERTLPLDARLISVAPRDEKGVFKISLVVNAKKLDDLSAFLDALNQTGSFYDMDTAAQDLNDDGTFTDTLIGSYVAPQAPTAPAAKPGGKGKGEPAPNGGRP
jgi:Tfp pilus assembly protein PilN